MHEQSNIQEQSLVTNIGDNSRCIDPKNDFAFKHFFGKEPHKDLLIKFLNSLFKGRKVIVDIQYNNVEQKGILKTYRKTVFDLYCTGDKGEKFIIEMQKADRDHFKYRIIFYTANLIQEQGISVNVNWNYEKFFKIAEVSNLSQEDMDAYQQSLKIQRDNYSAQKTAKDKAEAKGKRENAIEVA